MMTYTELAHYANVSRQHAAPASADEHVATIIQVLLGHGYNVATIRAALAGKKKLALEHGDETYWLACTLALEYIDGRLKVRG